MTTDTQEIQPADWEVVIGHYGKLLILRYRDEEKARNALSTIEEAMENYISYKNDRKHTLTFEDLYGTHVIAVSETKSVTVLNIPNAQAQGEADARYRLGMEPKEIDPRDEASAFGET